MESNHPVFTDFSGNEYLGVGIHILGFGTLNDKCKVLYGIGWSKSFTYINEFIYGPTREYEIHDKLKWMTLQTGVRYLPFRKGLFFESILQISPLLSSKWKGNYVYFHQFLGGPSSGSGNFEEKRDVSGAKFSLLVNLGFKISVKSNELFFTIGYNHSFNEVYRYQGSKMIPLKERLFVVAIGFSI